MRQVEVLVVGGGPIGAVAARAAAENGASVLLVEERSQPQQPPACTGLVSPRTLAVLGAPESVVLREIRRVTIHAPGGAELAIESTVIKAVVLDREKLESLLLDAAAAAGVEVRLGVRADWESVGAVRLTESGRSERIATRLTIGADGPESSVARECGLHSETSATHAVQAEIELVPVDGQRVDVYVGHEVAPGYFAWAVPAQDNRLRVGLAVGAESDPMPYLTRLLSTRFPQAPVISKVEAWIPIPPGGATVTDGVLIVGDAAAHVKPLSGGGLYFGGLCARIAGRVAAQAVHSGDVSAQALRPYEEACRAAIGAEMRFGSALRSILQGLSDSGIDSVIDALQDEELRRFAAERGDIDRLGQLVMHAAAHPRLWRRLLSLWTTVRAAGENLPPDPTVVASP
jgi:digeranylgeranylglycerophospholipid reductase